MVIKVCSTMKFRYMGTCFESSKNIFGFVKGKRTENSPQLEDTETFDVFVERGMERSWENN